MHEKVIADSGLWAFHDSECFLEMERKVEIPGGVNMYQ